MAGWGIDAHTCGRMVVGFIAGAAGVVALVIILGGFLLWRLW